MLPAVGRDVGREVAERLRLAVCQVQPAGMGITLSIGVSAARGEAVDYEPLFKAADEALYRAKRAGRDRVVVGGEPVA